MTEPLDVASTTFFRLHMYAFAVTQTIASKIRQFNNWLLLLTSNKVAA